MTIENMHKSTYIYIYLIFVHASRMPITDVTVIQDRIKHERARAMHSGIP